MKLVRFRATHRTSSGA